MAGYFEEMNWEPLGEGQAPDNLLHMARLLRDSGLWFQLNFVRQQPPPASKEFIEKLEQIKIENKDTQCPVCLSFFEENTLAFNMPCKHLFHKDCILPWLEKTNTCPLCRMQVPTDDEEYEAYQKEKKREKQRVKEIENLHDSMYS